MVVLTVHHAAILHAQGKLDVGGGYDSHSITGGEFAVELKGKATTHGVQTLQPTITGRAFVYGTSQLGVDPEDPYQLGVCLSDMWGEEIASRGYDGKKLVKKG